MSDRALSFDEFFDDSHETPEAALAEARDADPEPRQTQLVQRWRVDALHPNQHNAGLFPDSLSEASIEPLARELKGRGLKVPVRIRPDGTIIDGERRWRAAKLLGWDMVDAIVEDVPDEELLDAILGYAISVRRKSVREQVLVYRALANQLKQRAGRAQGRPSIKECRDGQDYLKPEEIQERAAKLAGFSSVRQALRAEVVFTRGTAELQEQVVRGDLSVSAAYDQVPKQPRKKPEASTPAPVEAQESSGGDESDFSELGVGVPAHPNPFLKASQGEADADPDSAAPRSDTRVTAAKSTPEPQTGPGGSPAPSHEAPDLEEEVDDEGRPADHLDALCAHLERLRAGRDDDELTEEERYEAARYTAEVMVERLWAAVGEPPEPIEEDEAVLEEDDEECVPDDD